MKLSVKLIGRKKKMLDAQSKMVSNEVSSQNSPAVGKAVNTNANMNVTDQQTTQVQNSSRTQDDNMVPYVFPRQNETEYPSYTKSRWFGNDDPTLIDVNYI